MPVCRPHPHNSSPPPLQAELSSAMNIMSVTITPRSDCHWAELGGARVLLGNRAYKGHPGPVPLSAFQECATVPSAVTPGQLMTINCVPPVGVSARYVLIYLPKKNARLTLCEVDMVGGWVGGWGSTWWVEGWRQPAARNNSQAVLPGAAMLPARVCSIPAPLLNAGWAPLRPPTPASRCRRGRAGHTGLAAQGRRRSSREGHGVPGSQEAAKCGGLTRPASAATTNHP